MSVLILPGLLVVAWIIFAVVLWRKQLPDELNMRTRLLLLLKAGPIYRRDIDRTLAPRPLANLNSQTVDLKEGEVAQKRQIISYALAWLVSREYVKERIDGAFQILPSGLHQLETEENVRDFGLLALTYTPSVPQRPSDAAVPPAVSA